jgi:hypothetical protein
MKIYHDLPVISNNDFYSGMHWTKRRAIAKTFHEMVWYLCRQYNVPEVKSKCKIIFMFNNKLDTDNNSIMAKMIIDGLKKSGILIDDTRKHVSAIEIIAGDSNYFEIEFKEE